MLEVYKVSSFRIFWRASLVTGKPMRLVLEVSNFLASLISHNPSLIGEREWPDGFLTC